MVVGINDLANLHPEIAKEAVGWDTSKVLSGSSKKNEMEVKGGKYFGSCCRK